VTKNGWAHLSVKATSDSRVSDDLRSYAAGWLEGFASARQLRDFQHNAGALIQKDEANTQALDNIKELFHKEIQTICQQGGVAANATAPPIGTAPELWWRHARYMLMQAWGMLDAYNMNVDEVRGVPMSMVDLFVLNSDGETPELEKAYDFQEMALRESIRECGEGGDCDGDDNASSDTDSGNSSSDTDNGSATSFLQLREHVLPDVADAAFHYQESLHHHEAEDSSDDSDDDSSDDTSGEDPSPSDSSFLQSSGASSPHTANRELLASVHAERERVRRSWNDRTWRNFRRSFGRCSALVRLTPNNSDIFVGHTTFSDYSEMNRIFKHYDIPLTGVSSQRMSFSSYPGVMGSTDDYYIMDTGLVVTETTVSMLSDEAFDKLDDNGTSVPDYMRIMLASRLARTGKDWVDHMVRSATGTYNSQWMVVDYKAFEPHKPLKNGTLWVLEQAPGVSHSEDASAHLQKVGFWASENRAAFGDIRAVTGEAEAEGLHGRLFSPSRNPRAVIFAKTAPSVATLPDMRAEMQRNKWPHEVDMGYNTPDHAIAARGDLVKEDSVPNGGVDAKVTSFCLARQLVADAICGPAHDGLPPFRWKDGQGRELFPSYPHDGLPDTWDFDWVRMAPDGEVSGPGGNGVPAEECRTAP
jgi:hypothetical protein